MATNNGTPIIIGGGVAGLMAALHLAERGLPPLLLEADPEWIGGRLKDGPAVEIKHRGRRWRFPGEHGVHGIWAPYRNLQGALARHDIRPVFVPAREETWVFGRGKKVRRAAMGSAIRYSEIPAPFHYLYLFLRPRFLNILTLRDVAAMFRVLGSLFSAMAIDPLAEQKSLQGMSLAEFTAGWSPTLRGFFAGLARSALAAHPDEVPASGFIAFLRFYTLLRRDAWDFSYLPGTGGMCVCEPLADAARRLGTVIQQGAQAVSLQWNGEWRVTVKTARHTETVSAAQVILAVDAPAAKELLRHSPATARKAAGLRFPRGVPTAIIRLWFDAKPRPMAEAGIFTGDFVMDNFFWLNRLQPAYMDWSRETGGSAIEMHIYGPPDLLAQPDASLLAQVIVDAYRAFPELRGELIHSTLLRNRAAHTLFQVFEPGQHLAPHAPPVPGTGRHHRHRRGQRGAAGAGVGPLAHFAPPPPRMVRREAGARPAAGAPVDAEAGGRGLTLTGQSPRFPQRRRTFPGKS
ncbi:MAG: FAD-dependent oxidoreductase, partial [Anaerolineae bacterium]